MKIVQVVTQMEAGGAQRVALSLATGLRERGHEVSTWFLYRKRAAFDGRADVRVLLPHAPSGLELARITFDLTALMRSERPDAVIAHTHYSNVLGLACAAAAGVPRRVAVQHNPVHSYPRFARLLDGILGSTSLYSANIAVADNVIDSMRHYLSPYRRRLRRIYNGVPHVVASSSRDTLLARHRINNKAPLIVSVGRLARQKNHEALLTALRALPQAVLVLIGDGELFEQLNEQAVAHRIADRVHFLRELPWEDTVSFVAASDVFAFPSIYEAMPLALLEAMQLARPIVASDIPAIRETLGDCGTLVPPHDHDALAAAIGSTIDSPHMASALGARAAERATAFSLPLMIRNYESLLSGL